MRNIIPLLCMFVSAAGGAATWEGITHANPGAMLLGGVCIVTASIFVPRVDDPYY